MNWISIDDQQMPLETDILVSHKHGVEGIHFFGAKWTYWYSNEPVRLDVLKNITHWCKPEISV